MIIGPYDLRSIETGSFALDGGAMFGVVPKPLWEKEHPADERNRIRMAARVLLIRGGGRTILVDTGNGEPDDPKRKDIFKFDTSQASLLTSLARAGVAPGDVTDVILTHLHFDHAGGATRRVNGALQPTFPHARYHVQKAHWEAASRPTERDRASFVEENYLPLHDAGQLEFIDGEGELFPGIRLFTVFGHTTALQCPQISDGTTTLFYCADLVPLRSHVRLPWIMGYDLRPLVTLEEKRTILQRAFEEHWVLFFEHDPELEAATIAHDSKGYRIAEGITV
ncbi:MAG: Glyoxylase, beta-lactamase superfamily [Bacteroidetes bacterium]|nr:Glyoxylase, beta-lactamase superfamily [Bacteroidota bacterium]